MCIFWERLYGIYTYSCSLKQPLQIIHRLQIQIYAFTVKQKTLTNTSCPQANVIDPVLYGYHNKWRNLNVIRSGNNERYWESVEMSGVHRHYLRSVLQLCKMPWSWFKHILLAQLIITIELGTAMMQHCPLLTYTHHSHIHTHLIIIHIYCYIKNPLNLQV